MLCVDCGAGFHCMPGGICMAAGTGGGGGSAQGGGDSSGGGTASNGGGAGGGTSSSGGGGTASNGGGSHTGGGGSATGGSSSTGGGGQSTCFPPCASNETCVNGDYCATVTCTSAGGSCLLPDAGYGECCGSGGSFACLAINTDVNNCGGCGLQCPAGSTCNGNVCSIDCHTSSCPGGSTCVYNEGQNACYPTTCAPGATNVPCSLGSDRPGECCGGACKAIWDDDSNCGGCGIYCQAGTFCSYGECYPTTDCSKGNPGACELAGGGPGECCGGACVALNTQTDPANCGGCGIHCAVGESCSSGECYSPDGGYSYGCVASSTTCPAGTTCNPQDYRCDTATCSASTLGAPCIGPHAGDSRCCPGNVCSNLYLDHDNCGTCGTVCGASEWCDYGQCRPVPTCGAANSGDGCPADGGTIGVCCGGACTNIATDSNNCGQCGAACPAGQVCMGSYCALPDGGYLGCGNGQNCPSGTVCNGNTCLRPGCDPGGSGEACAFGTGFGQQGYLVRAGKCCGGDCVDLTQDPENCGQCGTACTTGPQICVGSIFGAAESACLPQLSTNCFMCQANQVCVNGFCQMATCQDFSGGICVAQSGSIGSCCPQGFSSTCIDVASDPMNCGGCGVSCGGGTCTNGVCSNSAAACPKGHAGEYCNLDAGLTFACCPGAGCVDTSKDQNNCGRCGGQCTFGLSCVEGQCVALTCTASVQNDSCESDGGTLGTCCGTSCVHRGSDPNNCGSCGRKCVGSETCVSSECGVDVCDVGTLGSTCHFDAGYDIIGGLCCGSGCVDTDRDVNNCGGCNRHCPADAGCVNGNCQ
jgi:hypothetical protein